MQKYQTAFFAFILSCLHASAQLLSVTSSFPKDTSSITITVDCSRGNKGLLNYANTSDVYVHVGLITNLSSGPSNWQHVLYTWGTTTAGHATSLGNNKYSFTINNIRSFFSVPPAETILKVAILFRSGDGNTAQRNSDGSDMFVPVYTNAAASRFVEPFFEPRFT